VLVNKTILALDSCRGKCKLLLFEHPKGHSSNKDKASINKLHSLHTPAFPKSSALLAERLQWRRRRRIQIMTAGRKLWTGGFVVFEGFFAFFKHMAYTKIHFGCFHMFGRTNISA